MAVPEEIDRPHWPGLDRDFHEALMAEGRSPAGVKLRRRAEARFQYAEGKPFLLGPAQMIRGELATPLRRLTRLYHRAIESIVRASTDDERLRAALSTPPELAADLQADTDPANSRVHICRLDLMLDPDGGCWVLETNANCPGGFVFSGICNRAWRNFMEERGYAMPPALRHEEKGYMAKWVLEVMEAHTGVRPEFLGLIRENGGNRFELSDFAKHVRWQGVDVAEIDPHDISYCGTGPPAADGRSLTHAYQKLGMQPFQRMRGELGGFVQAVRDRALFVQNGQRGRWVGDDKLCLAIMSDPSFHYLFEDFDEDDWTFLQSRVPWSRNARLLDAETLREVEGARERFVLKRGLDTRGRGVVVGRGVDADRWEDAVTVARHEGWLVQEFHPTSWTERDFDAPELQRHDLALGAINGELTTLFMRSSSELRVNMARTGRMHPVFLGAPPEPREALHKSGSP